MYIFVITVITKELELLCESDECEEENGVVKKKQPFEKLVYLTAQRILS
jgi:hypothetical protein